MKVSVDLHADAPILLRADAGEMDIILNNLVSNAVKYNREGGRVDVFVEDRCDTVALRVADTGIGMSEEEQAKLFGEFSRIQNAKTRNVLGSGLGLNIMKKLALMYGGSVAVESKPDGGTTFTVVLQKSAGDTAGEDE